jgi:hypothetical protein
VTAVTLAGPGGWNKKFRLNLNLNLNLNLLEVNIVSRVFPLFSFHFPRDGMLPTLQLDLVSSWYFLFFHPTRTTSEVKLDTTRTRPHLGNFDAMRFCHNTTHFCHNTTHFCQGVTASRAHHRQLEGSALIATRLAALSSRTSSHSGSVSVLPGTSGRAYTPADGMFYLPKRFDLVSVVSRVYDGFDPRISSNLFWPSFVSPGIIEL